MATKPLNDKSELKAFYTSPEESQIFTHTLPSATASTASTEKKTAYLHELKGAVGKLQGEINEFLTDKMEQDKAAEKEGTGNTRSVDENKAEETYGEEDVEGEEEGLGPFKDPTKP
ncbi:uncharacterized protein KY384_004577 [Bacidia gigantensis]|uniref:uncharacterized protein n=1 Tax=Bacidia gigantensis TaxID=2732470 RepID=UPI001D03E246|nr:uncharacterized protein KY384_004577 [Bacidia gigantensis]KAG8531219.1 hypothetical protein KY384_004577 [Bacidia gigantensis]